MEKGGWSPSQEEGQGAGAIPTGLDLPHPALRKHSQHLPKRFTVAQSGGPFPLLGTRLYPGKAHPPQRRFGTPSDTLASHSLLPSLVSPHPYLSHCSGLSAFALPPPPPRFTLLSMGTKSPQHPQFLPCFSCSFLWLQYTSHLQVQPPPQPTLHSGSPHGSHSLGTEDRSSSSLGPIQSPVGCSRPLQVFRGAEIPKPTPLPHTLGHPGQVPSLCSTTSLLIERKEEKSSGRWRGNLRTV